MELKSPHGWVDVLIQEMDRLGPDDFLMPTGEVHGQEQVVGTVSGPIRKLYTLAERYDERAALAQVRYRFTRNPEERTRVEREMHECANKAIVLRDFLWLSIHEEYGFWPPPPPTLFLRQGWQLVKHE